jgi:chorismate mutase
LVARTPDSDVVVELAQYLRETIAEMDESIAEMVSRRNHLAVRLAVIDAATDEVVLRAVEDYEQRAASGSGYPEAEPVEQLLAAAEALARA